MYETSCIFYTVFTFIMPELLRECTQLDRWRKEFRIANGYIRSVQICQKSRRHFKIPGTRCINMKVFYTEDPQMFDTNIKNLVS